MRKFDAVLLSALVLYDYSASTVVDKKYFDDPVLTTIEELSSFEPTSFKAVDELLDIKELEEIVIVGKSTTASFVKAKKIMQKTELNQQAPSINLINMPDAFSELSVNIPTPDDFSDLPVSNPEAEWTKDILSENNLFLDSDNDGVFDLEDKCPYVDGVARFDGCPVPDTDGDGVNDEEDYCPLLAGSSDNNGCPITIDSENNQHTDNGIDDDDGKVKKKKLKKKSKLKALHF